VRRAAAALAFLLLAAHLTGLPSTLEDLDSVNFAMGVRDFDVAQHQPHPPGYPVFIALGKLGTAALSAAGVAGPDARGLAIWSALGAALLAPLLFAFFRSLDDRDDGVRAAIATLVTVCSPLVWFNAIRPMSDVAGLAVAVGSLAALMRAAHPEAQSGWAAAIGGFLAGVSIGIRSQMAILTLPLLAFAIVRSRRHRIAIGGALAVGLAVWAIPLIVSSGGPAGYMRALGSQAGEDFSGVVMLWTNPSPRVAAFAILHTFVRPWDSPLLAGAILSLAGAGALLLLWRAPGPFALLLLTFAPYAVFHLLFQEPLTTRYALPLIPFVAYLAAATLAEGNRWASTATALAIVGVSLACAWPAAAGLRREGAPIFALLSEMRALQARGAKPVVVMHRRVLTESRRARAYAGEVPGTLLPAPRDYEWLEMTRAWREGHEGETWFVADPRRTDLALFDRSHARVRQYRWPFDSAIYLGGTRPNELDWHVVDEPAWFLEQGWALTPETAGIADRDGWGPHRQPSIGWVRRRSTASTLMIGGRHLGGDPPVTIAAHIDDRPIASLEVRPGYFLEMLTLPAGALDGAGRYAKLTVTARAANAATPPVAIEQFDLQPQDRIVFGVDQGWYEPEFNPSTARSWRWMSDRAVVRVRHAGGAVRVRIAGESPLHYFDRPPLVRIGVGDRVLAESRPDADFAIEAVVPADLLAANDGRVTLTSDLTFVPGEREGTADRRRLALKIYTLTVEDGSR
jgi:hypothetical protein